MTPAPFEADVQLEDGVRVITVRGELDLSTAPDLEPALEAAVGAGDVAMLIDLSACEFIDSTGIALLVRAWQHLDGDPAADNGRFALCGLNDQVRRLLELSGLSSSLSIHPGRDEALASLRG